MSDGSNSVVGSPRAADNPIPGDYRLAIVILAVFILLLLFFYLKIGPTASSHCYYLVVIQQSIGSNLF